MNISEAQLPEGHRLQLQIRDTKGRACLKCGGWWTQKQLDALEGLTGVTCPEAIKVREACLEMWKGWTTVLDVVRFVNEFMELAPCVWAAASTSERETFAALICKHLNRARRADES